MRLEPFSHDAIVNPVAADATLDEVLALNADRDPDAVALHASGLPFPGSWREIDRAVSALAATFDSWRLGEDAVVGVQLGSSPQGALVCLALWRAGLVPAMLPLAWRRREMAQALSSVGATAIVAATEAGGARPAELACEVAAGLDTIRFIGAFGEGAPDGATPLDHVLDEPSPRIARHDRPDDAADHVAVVTFEAGGAPVPRSHNDLVAAALQPLMAARLSSEASLLSTLDLAGLAGLATGLAPWLMAGCAAGFHAATDSAAFAQAAQAQHATHVVLPGRAAARLIADGALDGASPRAVIATWRAPDGRGAAVDLGIEAVAVDVTLFGELGLAAAVRPMRSRHPALPLGPSGPEGVGALIDLKVTAEGRLVLRGPACPQAPCPAAPTAPSLVFDAEGYLDTGLAAVADTVARRVSLGGRRRGVAQIGGLSALTGDIVAAYDRTGVGGRPEVVDDPVFGARVVLSGASSEDDAAKAGEILAAAGFGPALRPVARPAAQALKSA